jgi:hypothetical protein
MVDEPDAISYAIAVVNVIYVTVTQWSRYENERMTVDVFV